ncbi:hypothetical protein SFC65_19535 [Priestia filamentosa]|uniref:hypothetical protein n=1 Tax=Priestia filamentosa TaxID=1402861 RepID=UPI003982C770
MHYVINELEKMEFLRVNNPDILTEVCIHTELPNEVEREYELSDYDISVRFHKDGEVDVFVYDNVKNETSNIEFTTAVRNKLIEFANQYI